MSTDRVKKLLSTHRLILIRSICLVFAAGVGILLAWCGYKYLGLGDSERLKSSLILLFLVFPTLGCLWFFRTQDVRENIHHMRENIHQNELFDALKALIDDKVVSREVATVRLIELSKKVPEYNEQIKMAFVKVLLSFPAGDEEVESGVNRTYAAPILIWLKEQGVQGDNTDHLILDMQDFTKNRDENNKDIIKFYGISEYGRIRFRGTNLVSVDLRSADLLSADLRGADLLAADLEGANLAAADLQGANLRHANLQGAKLHSANLKDTRLNFVRLQGADLQEADLQRVNLQLANLQGANLRNSNLINAELEDAIYDDDTQFSEDFNPAAHGMVRVNKDEKE